MSDFSLWFHSFYSRSNRIALHLFMWLVFGIFVELGLVMGSGLSSYSSMFFLGRSIVVNGIVFYLFFYLVFPCFILRRKIIASLLLTTSLAMIWQMLSYFVMVLINRFVVLENALLQADVAEQVRLGLSDVFTLKNMLGSLIFIIASLSPVCCVKIIVDITLSAYRRSQMEKEKVGLELSFLKSQLNPHFLFNTLNSIYILNMKKDKAAGDVILELSDTLRYTLYESNAEKVLLEKELDFLENYVKLETVRQNKRTRIAFDRDLSDAGELSIAPLLTFPFIENAFKHGLGTSLKDAWLEMSTKVVGHTFHFKIRNSKNEENNGTMLDEYPGGIGVSNTKKRLALLYPGKHILEIMNTPDVYSIELVINLKND